MDQWLNVADDGSEKVSCGAPDLASCTIHCGVVVPIPQNPDVVILPASVPPFVPTPKIIASVVPEPEVDLSVSVEAAPVPPTIVAAVTELNVGEPEVFTL